MRCFRTVLLRAIGPLLGVAASAVWAPARGQAANDEDDSNARQPADVHVEVLHEGPRFPWILKLRNDSDEALQIVTDIRLLWFEATPPEGGKPITCRLPTTMFPDAPYPPSVLEFEPGEFIVRTFDPRFFCFSTKEREALAAGAELVPFFGWPDKTKTVWRRGKRIEETLPAKPPFVAEPVNGDRSAVAPRRNAVAAPIVLDEGYMPRTKPPKEEDLNLRILGNIDAHNERSVLATLEFTNVSEETIVFFLRRELVTFEVLGPDGLIRCQALPDERFPDERSFIRLGPGKTFAMASRLVELCPRGTFARPGFYLINATFDAIVDGSDQGIDAFSGKVRSQRPVLLRVHTGEMPFRLAPQDPELPDDDDGDTPKRHRRNKKHRPPDDGDRPNRHPPPARG